MWKSMFQLAPENGPVDPDDERYRSLTGPSRGSIAMIGLVTVLAVVVYVESWQSISLLTDYLAGNGPTSDDVIASAENLIGLGFVSLLMSLPAGVLFLVWLWRARRNAELQAGAASQRTARGWTIGGFFCPVVNLWMPYQIVIDIYRASSDRPRFGNIIGVWWALLTLNYLIGITSLFVGVDGDVVGYLHTTLVLQSIGLVLTITTAALVSAIIVRITEWQQVRQHLSTMDSVPA